MLFNSRIDDILDSEESEEDAIHVGVELIKLLENELRWFPGQKWCSKRANLSEYIPEKYRAIGVKLKKIRVAEYHDVSVAMGHK